MSSRATMFSCFILESKNRKQTSPFLKKKKKKKAAFDVKCSQKCVQHSACAHTYGVYIDR